MAIRSEEHTSELQSPYDLVVLHSFPTRRSSDLGNPAALNQLFGDGHLGSASGFSEDPFGSREQLDAFEDFLIRDALTPAAGFAHRLKDIVAVGGIADGD